MEIYPREGVVKEEKFPNTRKPSHRWVYGEFWNLRGQHNREKTNKQQQQQNPTDYAPKLNSHWRSSPDAPVRQKPQGAEQGDAGCMLRVRTRPECPKNDQRELT